MSYLDLNTADQQNELIPDGTECKIRLELIYGDGGKELHATKSGLGMLKLQATVTDGKFRARKFWPQFVLEGAETDGQKTAVDIARKTLRAIVEAARGISPIDETAAAVKARKLASLEELDGMECSVIVGVEKGKDGFDDKNSIRRVIASGKESAPSSADEAASMRKATSAGGGSKWK